MTKALALVQTGIMKAVVQFGLACPTKPVIVTLYLVND
tara:strand:- start:47 stop:160 length:114 start_codon:yes stop_codon:yes gene_type:complete